MTATVLPHLNDTLRSLSPRTGKVQSVIMSNDRSLVTFPAHGESTGVAGDRGKLE